MEIEEEVVHFETKEPKFCQRYKFCKLEIGFNRISVHDKRV